MTGYGLIFQQFDGRNRARLDRHRRAERGQTESKQNSPTIKHNDEAIKAYLNILNKEVLNKKAGQPDYQVHRSLREFCVLFTVLTE